MSHRNFPRNLLPLITSTSLLGATNNERTEFDFEDLASEGCQDQGTVRNCQDQRCFSRHVLPGNAGHRERRTDEARQGRLRLRPRLPRSFPRNDKQIDTDAGDIILYQGNSITIYYDKNSWNFTRLARIDNVNKKRLQQILGKGNVKATFSVE
nr:cyclophilin-like fold protein [Fibrobacter sp. UWP2]